MILPVPAIVVFEGWAFLLMAADFKLRHISVASERHLWTSAASCPRFEHHEAWGNRSLDGLAPCAFQLERRRHPPYERRKFVTQPEANSLKSIIFPRTETASSGG